MPKPKSPPLPTQSAVRPPTAEERRIIDDFTPRELTEDEVGKIFTLNALACDMSLAVGSLVPNGRERNKALQLLRSAFMWAAEGIAKAPIQPKIRRPPEPDAKPARRKPADPPGEGPRMDPDPPVRAGRRRPRARRGDG